MKVLIPLSMFTLIFCLFSSCSSSSEHCKDWEFDISKNEITYSPSYNCQIRNNTLSLAFDDYLGGAAASEKQKALLKALSDDYLSDLEVNGEPFDQRLKGMHSNTQKPVFLYDIKPFKGEVLPGQLVAYDGDNKGYNRQYVIWNASGEKQIISLVDPTVTRKPVIYLYPEKEQLVQLAIDLKHSQFTTTYPKYPQGGWEVMAQPDGTLTDPKTEKEYYALYWEAETDYQYDLSTGFVVKGEETASFLEEKLEILGLSAREANEFIIYWLPIIEQNAYNLIHFSTTEYATIHPMQIQPKPESLIRFLMVYQPLDQPVEVARQVLAPVERKGFTVVEWGGQLQEPQDDF